MSRYDVIAMAIVAAAIGTFCWCLSLSGQDPDPQECRTVAAQTYADMLDRGLSHQAGQDRLDKACSDLDMDTRWDITDAAKEAALKGYRP